MFKKGIIKDQGIDITIKNNPDHFLSPNDWDKVLDAKFGKIPADEYKKWYYNLLRSRWADRKEEFIDLAKEGLNKEIKLRCFCPMASTICHAHFAADFMNTLAKQLNKTQ